MVLGNRIALAREHSLAGDYDRAIAEYDSVLEIDPACGAALCGRGYCRRALGELDGAIADLTEGMRLEPRLTAEYGRHASHAYLERAESRLSAQRYAVAAADLSDSLRLHVSPTGFPGYVHYLRGNCRSATGDLLGAIEDYDEALRLGYTGYRDCVIENRAAAVQSSEGEPSSRSA